MKKFRDTYLDTSKELRILDIGSSDVNGSYASLFEEPKWTYHGADMVEGKNVNIILVNPYNWENISENSYDVVISGQAYEHIEFFWVTSLQINRVLKIGGLCCIVAPSAGHEHRFPTDCWRYYPDGLRALAKWARMEVLEATTQWGNQNYDDGSDEWKDSMLVCMKVMETHHLKKILEALHSWLEIKKNPEIEKIEEISMAVRDLETEKENFAKMLHLGMMSSAPLYPDWYKAMAYLMQVYHERVDLQKAFPKVTTQGELTELFCWATNFGTNEDLRIASYLSLYKKWCNLQ